MEKVFALDIGTRVVIGLVMQKTDQGYEIIASSRMEHAHRVMYDGQVHDVDEVASAVAKVKNEIEEKLGTTLKKVAVSAAGRALCTQNATVEREEAFAVPWEREAVLALELEAVQKAMNKISPEAERGLLHCVGYSVVKQQLEDLPITSLVGQRGKKAQLTVIATFLPRTVIDGLLAVLDRVNLEMESLTLEPIAAGQAVIPADMRRLNLALVDVGAGTADIALTKEGTFYAYGMVPMAGDEVTEVICSHYLLDFQEAERIKKELSEKNNLEMVNFFGQKEMVAKEEILDLIKPTVKSIAQRINEEIIALNKGKPQAIILVGGGSLTPLLAENLAQEAGLPSNRVGVRVRERINGLAGEEQSLNGPDVITPIGIGITALNKQGLHYYSVKVNGVIVPLFDLQPITVAEALLAAGIQPRSFLGRPGAALFYQVNGENKLLKGELGIPAKVTVNGLEAKMDQVIAADDVLTFVPGRAGAAAKARIKDIYPELSGIDIYWNGKQERLEPQILMDGKKVGAEEWLKDGCKLEIRKNNTLYELLNSKGYAPTKIKKQIIKINGLEKELTANLEIRINGQIVTQDCPLKNKDRIDISEQHIRLRDLELEAPPMNFIVNGSEFFLPPQEKKVFWKGKELSLNSPVEAGMELRVEGFARKPILSELLPYLNLREKAFPGGRLQMTVNGKKAEFTTELNQGDRIQILWVER
ncbi:MAG: cell division protein FtsA [Desulfitobacteriia bacterium]|jgi:cell division protein FtsA